MKAKLLKKVLSCTIALAMSLSMFTAETFQLFAAENGAKQVNTDSRETQSLNSAETGAKKEAYIISEAKDKRTENSKTFLQSDGSYVVAQYNNAVHYKDDNNEWQDIDNSLSLENAKDKNDTTGYTNKSSSSKIKFANNANSDKLIKIKNDEYTLSWGIKYASESDPVVSENVNPSEKTETSKEKCAELKNIFSGVVYEDVYSNVDLQYILKGNDVKENIIINNKLSAYDFAFDIKTDLSLILNKDGSISGMNSDNEEEIVIPAPFMYDADNTYSNAVSYKLEKGKNKQEYTLTVSADDEWINSGETQFPVIIDPVVSTSITTSPVKAYVSETNPDNTYTDACYVGYSSASLGNMKLYYKFTIPTLSRGDVVVDADLNLYQYANISSDSINHPIYLHEVTEAWATSGTDKITWNNQPVTDDTIIDYNYIGTNGTHINYDVTKLVKKWLDSPSSNYGLSLNMDTMTSSSYDRVQYSVNLSAYYTETPIMTITYRNTKGLEDYWSYQTFDAGNAGTAYVNSYNGNLVLVHNDVSTHGSLMPISISHVFNGYMANECFNVDKPDGSELFSNTFLGKGWKLSIQQTITEVTNENVSDNGFKYMFTDEDGTEHYFAETETSATDNKYIDEDGLNLTLEVQSDGSYKMYNDSGDTKTFNSTGYLISVMDAEENTATIGYDANNRITTVTDGSGDVITLDYDANGYLTSIKDPDDRVTSYKYNSSYTVLAEITYPDETTIATTYAYASGGYITVAQDNSKGYGLSLSYNTTNSLRQVTSIYEYGIVSGTGTSGQSVGINYSSEDARTTYRFSGNDDIFNNSDDIYTTYIFDNYGRVTSSYSSNADGSIIYGANTDGYATNTANRIATNAGSGYSGPNIIKNGQAESTSNWTESYYGNDNTTKAFAVDLTTKLIGTSSFKVSTTSTVTSSKVGYYQNVALTAGKTYTYSAYVKTGSITGNGAFIEIRTPSNTAFKTSRMLNGITETNINNGWQRISVTFNVTTSGTYRALVGLSDCTGTAWFDCIQLQEGKYLSNCNLLDNSGFEDTSSWSGTGDYVTPAEPLSAKAFRISGSTTGASEINQTVNIYSAASDTFVLSGWAKADSVCTENSSTRKFGLKAVISYANSTTETIEVPFSDDSTGWQYVSAAIVPSLGVNINTIKIYCCYANNCNAAFFDNISLTKEEVSSYSYDSKGNQTSSTTSGNTQSSCIYDANGNLTSYEDASGYIHTYAYDNDNLTEVNNTSIEEGSQTDYRYTYDKGNQLTSIAADYDATSTTPALYSKNEYSANGDYLTKSYDNSGNATSYSYDTTRGLIEKITDPLGNKTRYLYDSDNDSLNSVFIDTDDDGVIDSNEIYNSYTYSQNRLSTITGNTSSYSLAYDLFGKISNILVGTQSLISNTYSGNNGSGKLSRSTYGNSAYTDYVYDELDRVIGINYNGGTTPEYQWEYDGNGNVLRHIDNVNNKTYDYEYDIKGNLVRSYEYNGTTNYLGSISNYDDTTGRLSSQKYKYGSETVQSYEYNYLNNGKISDILLQSGDAVKRTYDSLGRTRADSIVNYADTTIASSIYSYRSGSTNGIETTTARTASTNLVGSIMYLSGSTLVYTYDANGNILTITEGGVLKETYTYDSASQLIREDNAYANKSYKYNYDKGGNITSVVEYAYTTGTLGTPVTTKNYTYGSSAWQDKLTNYNGTSISYDAIGNPLSYRNGMTFTWQNGRELATLYNGSYTTSYKYNASGLRTQKTVNGTVTDYSLFGNMIIQEKTGTAIKYYLYDENGSPIGMKYGGSYYYFQKNVQGDVIRILNSSGAIVVTYTYDAWGNIISTTGTLASTVGVENPFRYRSYYYDTESGLYYLLSRYYDPVVKRFINADDASILQETQGELLSANLFSYCSNNPVMNVDPTGYLTLKTPYFSFSIVKWDDDTYRFSVTTSAELFKRYLEDKSWFYGLAAAVVALVSKGTLWEVYAPCGVAAVIYQGLATTISRYGRNKSVYCYVDVTYRFFKKTIISMFGVVPIPIKVKCVSLSFAADYYFA